MVCFQKPAEVTQKYLHKGARIVVIGTSDNHKRETDEGIQRSSFQIIANTLEFIKTDGRGSKKVKVKKTFLSEGTGHDQEDR